MAIATDIVGAPPHRALSAKPHAQTARYLDDSSRGGSTSADRSRAADGNHERDLAEKHQVVNERVEPNDESACRRDDHGKGPTSPTVGQPSIRLRVHRAMPEGVARSIEHRRHCASQLSRWKEQRHMPRFLAPGKSCSAKYRRFSSAPPSASAEAWTQPRSCSQKAESERGALGAQADQRNELQNGRSPE